jgi:hypothetical protein
MPDIVTLIWGGVASVGMFIAVGVCWVSHSRHIARKAAKHEKE